MGIKNRYAQNFAPMAKVKNFAFTENIKLFVGREIEKKWVSYVKAHLLMFVWQHKNDEEAWHHKLIGIKLTQPFAPVSI